MAAQLPDQRDLVARERLVPARSIDGPTLRDPSTADDLGPRRGADAAVVERALATAAAVHRSEAWSGLDVDQRIDVLERIGDDLDALGDGVEAMAVAESTGSGVPIAVTRMIAGSLGGSLRAAADQLRTGWTHTTLAGDRGPVDLLRLPWGPAVVLVPWNAPLAMAAGKVAMALAAGCPVVLKPPEWAPWSCNLLADVLARSSLPAGAFQMVHGGPEVGAALTGDPRCRAISFTGGLAAGRSIARAAAEHFPALQLELGGNNPVIVRADADVPATAASIAAGMIKLSGQWCEAPGKVLVHADRHDELVDALRSALDAVRIGHHLDDRTEAGPLSHEAHRHGLDDAVARLVADDGVVLTCGVAPDLAGWFWPPRLVLGVDPARCVDELFGPVVSIHPVGGDDEAVAIANDSPYGLAGYVFGDDLDAARALGRRIRFGEVKISGTSLLDLVPGSTQSFWGLSGIGAHGTAEVFRFFTGSQIVGGDRLGVPI